LYRLAYGVKDTTPRGTRPPPVRSSLTCCDALTPRHTTRQSRQQTASLSQMGTIMTRDRRWKLAILGSDDWTYMPIDKRNKPA